MKPNQNSLTQMNSGSERIVRVLPPLSRGRLSKAAYVLLEACRAHVPETHGPSSYEALMAASGLRSRASIAKALKELDALKIIEYRVRRDAGGQVAGLWMVFKGLPQKTPKVALAEYQRRAQKEYEATIQKLTAIENEMKSLKAGEGETP